MSSISIKMGGDVTYFNVSLVSVCVPRIYAIRMESLAIASFVLVWLNLFNAELSPKRYFRSVY